MAVGSDQFFEHIEAFFDYRKDIYRVSDQTVKSNRVDLSLFQSFVQTSRYESISGPAVMQFQYHLKKQRNNCGGSIEQVRLFFESICRDTMLGIRNYAVYALMYQTGLRVGEVHKLNIINLDFKTCKLLVTGKGGKRRELHLTDELTQVLSEWLAVRSHFLNSEYRSALFISKKGNRLAIRTMEDNFKKILAGSCLQLPFKVTCHSLRHSFASHLNDKDIDILVIQSLMGHASTRSTEPYIHPSLDKVRRAMEKLPAVIFMNQLIETGLLKLRFQNNQMQRE
jgi:site-specific recombinase XerD